MKITEIKEKLERFLPAQEVDKIIEDCIKENHLGKKEDYNLQEIDVILDHLITLGGFVEFTARLLKSKVIMDEHNSSDQ